MSGANVQKGKALENHVADELRAMGLDVDARRNLKKRSGDIVNALGWTIECKNRKQVGFYATADQVQRDSNNYQKTVIVWHPPRKPMGESVAIMRLADFLDILKFQRDHKSLGQILDRYRLKDSLKLALMHMKKRPEMAKHYIKEVLKHV